MVTFSALCSWLSLAAVCMALFYTYYLFAVGRLSHIPCSPYEARAFASSP